MGKIRIDPVVYIWAAVLLFLVPLRWLLAAVIAASVHEASHLAALKIQKCDVWEIRIGIFGSVIQTGPMSVREELSSALAGPAGSFLMILLYRLFPATALCAFAQGLFNLLPMYPLDGGRALRCCLRILSGNNGRLSDLAEQIVFFIVGIGLSSVFLFMRLYVFLLLFLVIGLHRSLLIKRPCKHGKLSLQ